MVGGHKTLMHILPYLLLVHTIEFLANGITPFSLWFFIGMVQGIMECLGLIQTWLVITIYHDQVNREIQIIVGTFLLGCFLDNFVGIVIVQKLQLFIACTTLALIMILGTASTSMSKFSSKTFFQPHHHFWSH